MEEILTDEGKKRVRRIKHVLTITPEDAQGLLTDLCTKKINRQRTVVGPWKIDCFEGVLSGIILAKITRNKDEQLDLPLWLEGAVDISTDLRFADINLIHAKNSASLLQSVFPS